MKFRPIHGLLLVTLVLAGGIAVERAFGGRSRFERVRPDAERRVVIDTAPFARDEVRFYRFLNEGNQEVRFFVGKDAAGAIQVAFDASENDFKMDRGFRSGDGWVINNKCDLSFRLTEINAHPSGCAPVPVKFRRDGDRLVLAEDDLLAGWRYFR
jgi:uncharacterized membrane protein